MENIIVSGFEFMIQLCLKYCMHFWDFIPKKKITIKKKSLTKKRDRKRRLMGRRKWILSKEKLKDSLVCIKDYKMMESMVKMKNVYGTCIHYF